MNSNKKIQLIHNVSSCYKMKYSLPKVNIYVKRDDTLDFAFGGNKARFAEYIGKTAVEKNVDKIITFGSIHSNHIRVIACLCNYLGIACDLIILTEDNESRKSGNFTLISHLDNVELVYCRTSEAHDFIDSFLASQKLCNYLWVPGGGHMKESALSYVEVAEEIQMHEKELDVHFDAVFLPCGTGTTMAGLVFGLQNCNTDVVGVSVARPIDRCLIKFNNLFNELALGKSDASEKKIYGNVISSAIPYGTQSELISSIIKNVAITDGFFLDPIYNAKSFLRMSEYLNSSDKYKNVLYLNTGGSPNLF